MAAGFEPRAVPARHGALWVREGLGLAARAPLAFAALGLVPAALLGAPGRLGDAGLAALPLTLALGAALARTIDEGRPALATRVSLGACARLAGAGAVIALAALAIVLALGSLAGAPGAPGAAGGWTVPITTPNAINAALADAARALWFWTLVLGPALWFAPALAGVATLPLAATASQCVHAFVLNPFLVAVWIGAAGTWWLATLVPVLVVPLTALHAATLYTGYRDLWLGRRDNAPRRAKAPVRAAGEVAARTLVRAP